MNLKYFSLSISSFLIKQGSLEWYFSLYLNPRPSHLLE